MVSGALFAAIVGILMMQTLCASNLASHRLPKLLEAPIMARALGPFGWMKSHARETNHYLLNAATADGESMTALIAKTPVSNVLMDHLGFV